MHSEWQGVRAGTLAIRIGAMLDCAERGGACTLRGGTIWRAVFEAYLTTFLQPYNIRAAVRLAVGENPSNSRSDACRLRSPFQPAHHDSHLHTSDCPHFRMQVVLPAHHHRHRLLPQKRRHQPRHEVGQHPITGVACPAPVPYLQLPPLPAPPPLSGVALTSTSIPVTQPYSFLHMKMVPSLKLPTSQVLSLCLTPNRPSPPIHLWRHSGTFHHFVCLCPLYPLQDGSEPEAAHPQDHGFRM